MQRFMRVLSIALARVLASTGAFAQGAATSSRAVRGDGAAE